MNTSLENVEHRGSGWTLWREVYGTFIGILPLILVVAGAAMTLVRDSDRHEIEIAYLKQKNEQFEQRIQVTRVETEKARQEILARMEKISVQIETLQIQVAKAMK